MGYIQGKIMKWYILAGIMALLAIPVAQAQLKSAKSTAIANKVGQQQAPQLSLTQLVNSAPVILVAEIIDTSFSSPNIKQKQRIQPNVLDLKRELKKATEGQNAEGERANFDIKIADSPVKKLKTVQTLKGPNTGILSIPMADSDFDSAQNGDLFLIMLGVNHPDAILKIKSLNDPTLKHIQSILD